MSLQPLSILLLFFCTATLLIPYRPVVAQVEEETKSDDSKKDDVEVEESQSAQTSKTDNSSTTVLCFDKHEFCPFWANEKKLCYSGCHVLTMLDECKASCGVCQRSDSDEDKHYFCRAPPGGKTSYNMKKNLSFAAYASLPSLANSTISQNCTILNLNFFNHQIIANWQ